jgi:hypothetical protein
MNAKPETLRQKQSRFVKMVALLIAYAYQQGFELTFGDAYREGDPRNHGRRLAIDLNLFRDGRYMASTEAHRPLGQFWESIGGCWGGQFNDGNHYSLEHNGVK